MNRNTLAIVAILCVSVAGCVERDLTITSQPEGALVYISDIEVGRTPLTTEFTWYGDYDIILRLDGHETLKTHAKLSPRWYEIVPLDFFSQIAPWTYHDNRYLHFEMDTAVMPSDEKLLESARSLRKRNDEPVSY